MFASMAEKLGSSEISPDWSVVKSNSIRHLTTQAFDDHGLYKPPMLLEFCLVAMGAHLFNYANFRSGRYSDGPYPKNFRASFAMPAPSAFSKSTYQKFLFHRHGLFSSPQIPCSVRGTFTPESWVGRPMEDGSPDPTAIFARYAKGFVAAEEFARLIDLMNGDGREPEEVYLLQGMDTPYASKDSYGGTVEHQGICTTIIAALRPPELPLNMQSGLGRRILWGALQLPGPAEFYMLNQHRKQRCTVQPDHAFTQYRQWITEEVTHIMSGLHHQLPMSLDLIEVQDWCTMHMQPHFVEEILERIAIGWSVVNGSFPNIHVDEHVEAMFRAEIRARRILKSDCLAYAVRTVVVSQSSLLNRTPARWSESEVVRFLVDYYQLSVIQARTSIANAILLGLVVRSESDLIAPSNIIEEVV